MASGDGQAAGWPARHATHKLYTTPIPWAYYTLADTQLHLQQTRDTLAPPSTSATVHAKAKHYIQQTHCRQPTPQSLPSKVWSQPAQVAATAKERREEGKGQRHAKKFIGDRTALFPSPPLPCVS